MNADEPVELRYEKRKASREAKDEKERKKKQIKKNSLKNNKVVNSDKVKSFIMKKKMGWSKRNSI